MNGQLPEVISSGIELCERSVIKRFRSREEFSRELEVYKLKLCMTPRLLEYQEYDWIELERIDGRPYLDLPFDASEAALLGETLARFHAATCDGSTCICHWDNQPRNILKTDKGFFLLDFSDSRRDYPEYDITHLLLFWASEFTPDAFALLSKSFIAAYRGTGILKSAVWKEARAESTERFDRRRLTHQKNTSRDTSANTFQNRQFITNLV
jgi:tRNA A-37 threonylcarbamoyl transferase component Bud32